VNIDAFGVLKGPYSRSNGKQHERTASCELDGGGTGVKSLPDRIIFLTGELERDDVRDVVITWRLPYQTRRDDNDSNEDPQQNQRENVTAQKGPSAALSALLAILHDDDDANEGCHQKTSHPGSRSRQNKSNQTEQ